MKRHFFVIDTCPRGMTMCEFTENDVACAIEMGINERKVLVKGESGVFEAIDTAAKGFDTVDAWVKAGQPA